MGGGGGEGAGVVLGCVDEDEGCLLREDERIDTVSSQRATGLVSVFQLKQLFRKMRMRQLKWGSTRPRNCHRALYPICDAAAVRSIHDYRSVNMSVFKKRFL